MNDSVKKTINIFHPIGNKLVKISQVETDSKIEYFTNGKSVGCGELDENGNLINWK